MGENQELNNIIQNLKDLKFAVNNNCQVFIIDQSKEVALQNGFSEKVGTIFDYKNHVTGNRKVVYVGMARSGESDDKNSFGKICPAFQDNPFSFFKTFNNNPDYFTKTDEVFDAKQKPEQIITLNFMSNSSLAKKFYGKLYMDYEFFVGEERKSFKIHRIFFAQYSKFEHIFLINPEKTYLPLIKSELFNALIELIYIGCVNLKQDQLKEFLDFYESFNMNFNDLEIDTSSILAIQTFFLKTNKKPSINDVSNLLISDLPNVEKDCLINYVGDRLGSNLSCAVIYEWVKCDPEKRAKDLEELLGKIRWRAIDAQSRAELLCAKLIPKALYPKLLEKN